MEEIVSITYYNDDGRITGVLQCPEQSAEGNRVGLWVEGEGDIDSQYVSGGTILDRPHNPAYLAGRFIRMIPGPGTLQINDSEYDVDGSDIELELTQSGTYKLVLYVWPYLPKEWEIAN